MTKMKKGSKAAKAWGAKMKRLRKSPAKRTRAVSRTPKRKTKRVGGIRMARRRRTSIKRYARKSSNIMSNGIIPTKGIIGNMVKGAGAAAISEKFVPNMIPYQNAVVGFAVGGIGGAAGALIKDLVGGFSSTGTGTPLNY